MSKRIKVGDRCECAPKKDTPWKYGFRGEIEKIYHHSAMVKIIATHLEDDHLVPRYGGRTIISNKRIRVIKT